MYCFVLSSLAFWHCFDLAIGKMSHLHIHATFYAPNFEEVEGAYWFGSVRAVSQSDSQSVCLSVMREHSGQVPLELGS